MQLLLSPAKNMEQAPCALPLTTPYFLEKTRLLAHWLEKYSPWELEKPMAISPTLAIKAATLHQQMDLTLPGTAAVRSYHGLAYHYLQAKTLSHEEVLYLQKHLFILSAFYGALRPLDGIHPYRLEFANSPLFEGKNLYHFWGQEIYKKVRETNEPLINLASAEYAKTVLPYCGVGEQVVTCDFLIRRKGKLCTLPTEAKMARGSMVRFAAQNRCTQPEQLQKFAMGNYCYVPALSNQSRYVFVKDGEELLPD